jgi:hypothetical protein
MLAMLRTCPEALASSACATTGNCSRMRGSSATSAMRASAPMRAPPGPTSMAAKGKRLMSISSVGVATRSCSSCSRSVPPAMNCTPCCRAARAIAMSGDAAAA